MLSREMLKMFILSLGLKVSNFLHMVDLHFNFFGIAKEFFTWFCFYISTGTAVYYTGSSVSPPFGNCV